MASGPDGQRAGTHVVRRALRLCLHSAAAPRCAATLAYHWPVRQPKPGSSQRGGPSRSPRLSGKTQVSRGLGGTARVHYRMANSWPFHARPSRLPLAGMNPEPDTPDIRVTSGRR